MVLKQVSEPLEHYEQIVKLNPFQVIFVLSKSEKREACIVLQLSKRQFEKVPGWLYVSDASGGNTQLLYSFYRLAKKLHEEWDAQRCISYIVPEEEFAPLINLHYRLDPKFFLSPLIESSPWLEDLLDVKSEWNKAREKLTAKYGYQLADAQLIIRRYLLREADARH